MTIGPETPDTSATPSRRPTLKDVARESGYHITTISLALRDHPSIPESTRRRIREIAQQIGYEKNPVYHALSRFRQQGTICAPAPRIAYLENFRSHYGSPRPPHLEALLTGARRHAELLGYQLDPLFVGEDHHDSHTLTQYLRENHITGIVIASFVPGFAEIALNWDDYAVAKIHSRHTEPDVTTVGNDQLREVRLAFRHLASLGYQRIGLAVGRADEDACGHRHTAGYLMEEAAIPRDRRVPPLLFPYNTSQSDLVGMIVRWARRHQVDAILCNWPSLVSDLAAEGLQIPDEVGFASLCLCEPAPGLAGVRPHLQLVGERAVSIVVAQLKSTERGLSDFPSSIHVQSTWQDGPTAPSRNR